MIRRIAVLLVPVLALIAAVTPSTADTGVRPTSMPSRLGDGVLTTADSATPASTGLSNLPEPGWRLSYVAPPSVAWTSGSEHVPLEASDYGICWLELVARDVIADSMALQRATTVRSAADLLFVEEAGILAHHYAMRDRNLDELLALPTLPATVEASLAAANPSPMRPARVFFTNEQARLGQAHQEQPSQEQPSLGEVFPGAYGMRGHYVLVVGRQTRGNIVAYTLRDPNRAQPTELLYDHTSEKFLNYGPYTTVRHDRAELPIENRAWLRALVESLMDVPGSRVLPLWIPSPPSTGMTATTAAMAAAAEAAQGTARGWHEPVSNDELPGVFVVLSQAGLSQAGLLSAGSSLSGLSPADSPPAGRWRADLHGTGQSDATGPNLLQLYFDPALVADGHDARGRWLLQVTAIERALTGLKDFVAQHRIDRTLLAVSLEEIERDPDGALGPLARIVGYARRKSDNHILLLGEVLTSRPPVHRDLLTAALRLSRTDLSRARPSQADLSQTRLSQVRLSQVRLSQTRLSQVRLSQVRLSQTRLFDSVAPSLWFDAAPGDPFGPRMVRTEGLSPSEANSPLGATLFEGDRVLKKILVGDDRPDVPGFQSAWDRLAWELVGEDSAQAVSDLKFWLRPRRAPGLGAYTVDHPDYEAVFFDERLAGFSDERQALSRFRLGAKPSPIQDRAARDITAHLNTLAYHRPYLADLQAAAELTRLVRELTARGVRSDALDRLTDRALPRIALPDTVKAFGPRLHTDSEGRAGGGLILITGGVRLSDRADLTDDIPVGDLLAGVIALFTPKPRPGAPDGGFDSPARTLDLRIPEILPLDPQRSMRLRSWLETGRAVEEFLAGQSDEALARLNLNATFAGIGPEVFAWRGLIRFSRGDVSRTDVSHSDYRTALVDVTRAAAAFPELLGARGRLRAYAGDIAGARSDATRAATLFPQRSDMLATKAWVELMARDLRSAQRTLTMLALLDPTGADLTNLRAELAYQKRLGSSGSLRHVHEALRTPPDFLTFMRVAQEAATRRDYDLAVKFGRQALVRARLQGVMISDARAVADLLLEERARLALASFFAARRDTGDLDSAAVLLDAVAVAHPTWWSPRVLKLEFGDPRIGFQRMVRLWEEANARATHPDPLGEDIRARRDEDVIAVAGFRLASRAMATLDRDTSMVPAMAGLLKQLAPRFRGAPEGRIISVWQNVMRILSEMRRGQAPDTAILKTIRAAFVNIPFPRPNAGATTFDALKALYATPIASPDAPEARSISADSAFLQLYDRLNIRWSTPDKNRQATQFLLEAALLHCDRNLTARMHQLLLYRMESLAQRETALSSERAIDILDEIVDAVLNRYPARGFTRPFLGAVLHGFYVPLLTPILEPSQIPELRALIAERTAALIPSVSRAARTPVEMRAVWYWLDDLGVATPARAATPEAASDIIRAIISGQASLNVRAAEETP